MRALTHGSVVPFGYDLNNSQSHAKMINPQHGTTESFVARTWPERRRTKFTFRSVLRKRTTFFHIVVFSVDWSFQLVLDWGFIIHMSFWCKEKWMFELLGRRQKIQRFFLGLGCGVCVCVASLSSQSCLKTNYH